VLTRSRSSVSPSCFPPTVLSLDAALPSTGSFRSSSPASPVLSGATTSCRPFRRTSFSFVWRYHGNTRDFAPGAVECYGVGPGVGNPVSPAGISSVETTGSPMFLGNPYLWLEARKTRPIRKRWIGRDTSTLAPRSAFALLSDPGGRTCQAVTTRPRGPRSDHDEGSRIATFEAQSHSFGTGCLRFAGWITPPPRKTRFRLPARLYRTGFPPAGFLQKVSNSHHVCYPPLPNFMAQAGWPRVIAHPGLPQIRTCRITASGSSGSNFASTTTY